MEKICLQCGKELTEEASFCASCGTPVTRAEVPGVVEKNSSKEKSEKTVGFWTFFGLTILFLIPLVGLIASIVFSFAPKNRNVKNFARATMVWNIVGLVIFCLFVGGVMLSLRAVMSTVLKMPLGEDFSQLGILEFLKTLPEEELQNLIDRYKNGEFDDLIDRFRRGELGDPDDLFDRYQQGEFGDPSDLLDQLPTTDTGTPTTP